jgi:hypothetical protein
VEFLRDENTTDSTGQEMYDLWDQNGKCPPEPMQIAATPVTDIDAQNGVDFDDFAEFAHHFLSECGEDDEECQVCNFDNTGGIDFADLEIFTQSWLWGK